MDRHLEYIKKREIILNNMKIQRKLTPWRFIIIDIRKRCNNPKRRDYRWYGAKGIKCNITVDELKELWFRDKAHEMNKPSIDRIDSKKDYEYSNCRFIEHIKNAGKEQRKPILQYSLDEQFIREWECINDAARELDLWHQNIGKVLKGYKNKCGGFKWKYKE